MSLGGKYVCYCDVFGLAYVYFDELEFCVLMALGMFIFVKVMSSLISVMRPPPCLCSLSVRMVV